MKRRILFLTLLLGISVDSFSQLELGISAGYNHSTMDIRRREFHDFGISGNDNFNFGIFLGKNLNEVVKIKFGLKYFEKGFTQDMFDSYIHPYWQGDTAVTINVTTRNIDIPFMVETKINFIDFYFKFSTGAYFGIGLNGDLGIESEFRSSGFENEYDDWSYSYETSIGWAKSSETSLSYDSRLTRGVSLKESDYSRIRRVDYGVILGFGFGYKMIELKLDYYYGLRNLMFESYKHETTRNTNLDISLIYSIKLKD